MTRHSIDAEPVADETIDPSFFEGLAEADLPDDEEIAAALELLDRRLERERGPLARLRSLPTSSRLGLGLGLTAGLVLAVALLMPRGDLGDLPSWRVPVTVVVTAVLLAGSVWFGLRPLHRPGVPRWVEPVLVAASLLGAVGLALLPLLGPTPEGPSDWAHAFSCMYGGILVAVPTFAVIRLLDRGGRPVSGFLAAAAAGLCANAALAMKCANDTLGHLMRGHVVIMVIFLVAFAGWRWVITQLQPPGRSG